MQIPWEVSYRNVRPTRAIQSLIDEKVVGLEKFYPRIVGCHVTIERPGRHHRHGKGAHFRVRVEETTLFNPLWSTDDGLVTRYRLYNTTNEPCAVTLALRSDDDQVPVGGTSTATFNLAANTSVSRHTGAGDLNLALAMQ